MEGYDFPSDLDNLTSVIKHCAFSTSSSSMFYISLQEVFKNLKLLLLNFFRFFDIFPFFTLDVIPVQVDQIL